MKEIYFASANGYRGFRSYFNEVFAEEGLDKLFILKGGPGTGKSTLMKRLAHLRSDRAETFSVHPYIASGKCRYRQYG